MLQNKYLDKHFQVDIIYDVNKSLKEVRIMVKFQDLSGKKYGMLTVLKQAEPEIKYYKGKKVIIRIWVCACECGTTNKLIRGTEIKRQKSCGCLLSAKHRSARVQGNKNPMFGMSGDKNPRWDSDRTSEMRVEERKDNAYYVWRIKVFKRDNYTCKCCNKVSNEDMVAHHIFNYRDYPEKRTDIDNGITLCKRCHSSFHIIYGRRNNTMSQLLEFIHDVNAGTIKMNDDEVKPYKVTIGNDEPMYYYTQMDIVKEYGFSEITVHRLLYGESSMKIRTIKVSKRGSKTLYFETYKEVAEHFNCDRKLIKKFIDDKNYKNRGNYKHLNDFSFIEEVRDIRIEKVHATSEKDKAIAGQLSVAQMLPVQKMTKKEFETWLEDDEY